MALLLAEVKGPVLDRLQNTPLGQRLQGKVFLSTHAAFEFVRLNAAVQPSSADKVASASV
jgi:SulP family sulfate permease